MSQYTGKIKKRNTKITEKFILLQKDDHFTKKGKIKSKYNKRSFKIK